MAISPLEAVGSRGLGAIAPFGASGATRGNGGTTGPAGDGSALSEEAREMQAAAMDAQLFAAAGEVEQAKGGGNPEQLNQLKEALANAFTEAVQQGLNITEPTQNAVHHALEDQQQGQGQQQSQPPAGNANGGAIPPNGGGGGAPPINGGGGVPPINGGGVPVVTGPGGGGGLNPGHWSDQDQAALNQALNADPHSFNNLIDGFHQTVEGNCASVGTIKEAMATYGNQVFDNVTANRDGGYDIAMQDGYRTSVSRDELGLANANSAFAGNDPQARSYATLQYAAMAKRQSEENGMSYGSALDSLNHGQDPYHTAHLLGLGDQLRSPTADSAHFNAWNGTHDVFVDRAHGVADHYGSARRFDGTDTNASRYGVQRAALTNAFTFQPRSMPSQRYNIAANHQHSSSVASALQRSSQPASSSGGGAGSAPAAPPPPPPAPSGGGGGGD